MRLKLSEHFTIDRVNIEHKINLKFGSINGGNSPKKHIASVHNFLINFENNKSEPNL